MARDVFISYKSEEYHQAREVRLLLEQAGISCWMAPEDIPGGTSYAMEIPQAIGECKFFVLILSRAAMASRWVSRELDQAINEGKTVMPLLIEQCTLTQEFGFYLRNVQQYFAYSNKQQALQALIRDIRGEETTPIPAKPVRQKPIAPVQSYQNPTQKEQEPQKHAVRKGMKVAAWVCWGLMVVYALMGCFLEKAILGFAGFFLILGCMFVILSKSPKECPYICGRSKGMEKGTLVVISLVAAFATVILAFGFSGTFGFANTNVRITVPRQTVSVDLEAFDLDIENQNDEELQHLKLVLRFYDANDNKICDTTVSSNSKVTAGVTETMTVTLHSSVAEKLYWYSWEELKITAAVTEVTFENTTRNLGKGEETVIKEAEPGKKTKLEKLADRVTAILEALDVVSVEDYEGMASVALELDEVWDIVVQREELMTVVYDKAEAYMGEEQYEKAYFLFGLLGAQDFRDSADKAIECYDICEVLEKT